jgi:hypothetical protein
MGAHPKAGECVVPVAGQSPLGSGGAPLFALFAKKTAATTNLISRFAAVVDPDIRTPFQESGMWLVRPDGYVACSSKDADVVATYLDTMIQPTASCRGRLAAAR